MFSGTVLFASTSQVIGCEDRLRNDLYCVEWGLQCFDAVGWAAERASGLYKKLEWWGTGMVICLDADLHMAQLISLPLTVSCFSKMQIGFTFLVPAHPGNRGKRAVKRVCVGR